MSISQSSPKPMGSPVVRSSSFDGDTKIASPKTLDTDAKPDFPKKSNDENVPKKVVADDKPKIETPAPVKVPVRVFLLTSFCWSFRSFALF